MRVAIIRQKYNAFGGAERFVERALAALGTRDVQLTLITRRWSEQGGARERFERVLCDPFYVGSTWRDRSFARAACEAVARGAFDLVQSHERLACCDVYRAGDGLHRVWLRQRRRAAGTWGRAWMDVNPYNRYVLAAEDALFRSPRLKAVICISRMVQREIVEHFGLPEAKLPVIYNGIDLDEYGPSLKTGRAQTRRALGIPQDAPLLLFVGSGFERKGVAALLRRLPREAWLLVVGKDRRLAHYQGLAARLGIAGRVRFAGPQADVKPYYGAADAFVFPTLYEPFGNVVLEAMAAGLPVLTSTSCGAAELIADGHNGWVCDAFDEEALGTCMAALSDVARAATMGEAARRTAEGHGLETMAQRMVALYQDLLARHVPA